MILIREVPIIILQQALYSLLKNGQNRPVYGGDAPEGADLPYITFGNNTAKPLLNKSVIMWACSMNIEVWGAPNQRKEVNEILNDISSLLSAYGESLNVTGYEVTDLVIDMVETYPEDITGYHGTITALFTLTKG